MHHLNASIRLLILDVDGVLTDGTFWISPHGEEYKAFHTQDGYGLAEVQRAGITVALISGRTSHCVTHRFEALGITHIYQGQSDKRAAFDTLLQTLNLMPAQVAYVGDDIPDLVLMKQVGCPIAVANAVDAVKHAALWTTQKSGGHGAVREVCDWLCQKHPIQTAHTRKALP